MQQLEKAAGVVGWIMTPKDAQALIPGTSENSKRAFTDMLRLRFWRWGGCLGLPE